MDDPLVLGAHLEGPFLSARHPGAHDPALLSDPRPAVIDRLLDASRGALRQWTLAPELPGALAAIERLATAGVVVAVGHTDADAAIAAAAFDAGARSLTHAFNGMRGIHHRDPGPVVAAISDDRVTLELILDGVHVDVGVARMLLRAAPGRVALVSDAMAAADGCDGVYALGAALVRVSGGVARLVGGSESISGSTLMLDAALRRAVLDIGLDAVAAVAAATAVPATLLGVDDRIGRLAVGQVSDVVLFDAGWHVTAVWADARRVDRL